MTDYVDDLQTQQEALDLLDACIRYEETRVDGRERIFRHRSMRYLFTIEQFVKDVQEDYEKKGKSRGFLEKFDQNGYPNVTKYPLAKTYYGQLNGWIELYREELRYSPYVEAFHDACKDLGLLGNRRFWFGEPGDTDRQHDKPYTDWFNALIVKVHDCCQSRKFKERVRLLKVHVKRNVERLVSFEQELFSEENGRARWLVVDLTLQYESKYRGSLTLDTVQRHRENFFKARRNNSGPMSCVKAYAWAIEEGETSGFHLHVILFCLTVTKDDERLGNQIGDFWSEIATEGKGVFHNSNRADLKPRYEMYGHGIGVGLIEHDDRKMRRSLFLNLLYLVKAEQQLQIRAEGNVHTFGMSDVPKKLKVGRPRNDARMQATGIDKSVDQQIDEAHGNGSDDIPWEFAVVPAR